MMESASPDEPQSSPKSASARNPFFPMVLFAVTVFIITILAMVAVIFSDPRAPVAKFLDANADRLIIAEVVVTLFLGLCALVVDRKQSRRERQADLNLKHQSPKNFPNS
jgi:hypothetical protein